MAGHDEQDTELFEALARKADEQEAVEQEQALFEQLAQRVEEPGIQDRILKRYQNFGRQLLADGLPSSVDPRIAKTLEPILGDVSDVRVHTGALAASAAKAMDARAFAIGDRDIFIDPQQFNPNTLEGGQLLAHEIAHTRDAATGFAMSANLGRDSSAREEFAHAIEHEFAREWEDDGEESAVRGSDEPSSVTEHGGMPKEPDVDRHDLALKIVDLLERQSRSFSDRTGRW